MFKNVVLVLLIGAVTSGCFMKGSDGVNGVPNLGIDWIEKPEYYLDENPAVPSTITKREFFETATGYYNFEYGYSDGFGWVGQYQIKLAEPGEKGAFPFRDGADGRDGYYTLLLAYSGSSFSSEYRKIVSPDTIRYTVSGAGYELRVKQWPVKRNPDYRPDQNKLGQ